MASYRSDCLQTTRCASVILHPLWVFSPYDFLITPPVASCSYPLVCVHDDHPQFYNCFQDLASNETRSRKFFDTSNDVANDRGQKDISWVWYEWLSTYSPYNLRSNNDPLLVPYHSPLSLREDHAVRHRRDSRLSSLPRTPAS